MQGITLDSNVWAEFNFIDWLQSDHTVYDVHICPIIVYLETRLWYDMKGLTKNDFLEDLFKLKTQVVLFTETHTEPVIKLTRQSDLRFKHHARDFMIVNMGIYFASLLVIPWTGNRNYCRYLCPWGSLYGLIGKWGFFKIVADKEECLECGSCEDVCDLGVPIQSLIQEKGEINVADCVGCGRCVQACPSEALRLVDVRDAIKSVVTS